tara:strand:- start:3760 stop:4095 length:336 start_codon:yes stop_codon:yes gene_type:complete
MRTCDLPDVGDIITFNSVWQLNVLSNFDDHFPNGVVTSKKKYRELSIEYKKNSLTLFGTLAYPLSIGSDYVDEQTIFIVRWATKDPTLAKSYRYINEEWFFNNSFIIVSRA